MASLKFKLSGIDGKPVDFTDFGDFASTFADVLRRVHRSENPGGKLPRFEIHHLEIGSAGCGIYSMGDGAVCMKNTLATIDSIRSKKRPSIGITNDDLRAFRRLTTPLDHRTESIIVEHLPIDLEFRACCDWMLEHSQKSYGQIIGRLEGMNMHAAKFFRIYPEGIDRGAECYYKDSFHESVIKFIGKRVRVEGLLHRDPDGIGLDRITDVRDLKLIPENDDLPNLKDLFGLFKDSPVRVASGWEN